MTSHNATEQAYRNGYEAGYKAAKDIRHWESKIIEGYAFSEKTEDYKLKGYLYFSCSGCGWNTVIMSKYCPGCGAKMRNEPIQEKNNAKIHKP